MGIVVPMVADADQARLIVETPSIRPKAVVVVPSGSLTTITGLAI